MTSLKNMNYEQKKAVDELKLRVSNDLTSGMREDSTLFYRFLKARDFDVDKAEKMLRKNITWRKAHQCDNILQNFKPSEFFANVIEPSLIGFDKDGDMLCYCPLGTYDIYDFSKSTKINSFLKHLVWFGEKNIAKLEKHNKETGNCRYQGSVILNLDKVTWKQVSSKLTSYLFFRIIAMYQDHYPERLKYAYFINAPRYMVYVTSALKTMVAANTAAKFRIFHSDGWRESLLEFVDENVLPAFLGGKRTDPDGNPYCRTFINHGGKISEKYFLSKEDRYFQRNIKVNKITVSSMNKAEINIYIEKAGYRIEWQFLTRNKDIAFGLFYQNSANIRQEVIPVQRYDTSDGTVDDSYKCDVPGTYIILFDNSYSWFSAKTVEYSINVVKTIM